MSWNITQRRREILAAEKGYTPIAPGGRMRIALIWPGSYGAAMSSLGYLSIYSYLNSCPDVIAERFFVPCGPLAQSYEKDGGPLLSLEHGWPLSEFELVAASLSLENDYWHFLKILKWGGLSPFSDKRTDDSPLVMVGGVAVWANPWPLVNFSDLILTGEAEAQWPYLISAWRAIRLSLPKLGRIRALGRKTPGAIITADMKKCAPHFTPPNNDNSGKNGQTLGAANCSAVTVCPPRLNWPPPDTLLPPTS
ncbi:MAG: hypothetical protein ACRCTY_01010, partial [Candidatus Adiutrix sp.]